MAGLWHVTTQTQREELNGQGAFVQVVEIQFELTNGTRGSVVIPSRLYSEEYAWGVIDAKAKTMNAVSGLTG